MGKSKYFRHPNALVSSKAKIGEGTRVWAFSNVLSGAIVGKDCNICDGCFIESGAVLGNHVTLKNGVAVFSGVTLEDDVFCGAHTSFINDRYPRSHRKDAWTLEKILIKKGATLGANSTIICGVTVGEYAVIGAGSVVTKDVAPYTVVVGNPARPKCFVCRCGRPLKSHLRCPCGIHFKKSGKTVVAVKQSLCL